MNWLRKLFSRLQCDFCGKHLTPPRFGPMSMEEATAMVGKIGFYCAKCQKVACAVCSVQAAKTVGAKQMVCPSCGSDISESYAT